MEGKKHYRRSIRLKGYDYSTPGAYFITICAYDKKSLFGEVTDAGGNKPAGMRLNDAGMIVYEEWMNTEKIRNEVQIDEFVIMPNHIHGIVWISERMSARRMSEKGQGQKRRMPFARTGGSGFPGLGSPSGTIGAMVRGFKSAGTRRLRDISGNPEMKVWHRNYWDHVIRDDADMARIREYVHNNPARWELDSLNCHRTIP